MRRLTSLLAAALLSASLLVSARAGTEVTPYLRLESLFHDYGDSGEGWTGGDTAYSVVLPDGRTAWLFSDTFLGPIVDHTRPNPHFIHNSIVIESSSELSTHYSLTAFGPRAAIEPVPPDGVSFYWLGDGTVEGNLLHVFALRFVIVGSVWQQIGNDIATLQLPDLKLQSIRPSPAGLPPTTTPGATISYGAAIHEAQDYTYVYGVEDLHYEKYVHLARAPVGDLFGKWEYFSGAKWESTPLGSVRIASGVSNEFSVTQGSENYRLIAQDYGIGKDIVMFESPFPWGPWTANGAIYSTPESGGNVVTYNAKEHPQLGGGDRIVVSYNVNSFDSSDHYLDIHLYRPRFIEIQI